MAASYVKELLAEKAGGLGAGRATLTKTLQELFTTFFPEKQFLGPQATPTGALSFPVVTTSGGKHDLDELSAGEKEILYGYLRIRNSAPQHSIILLDEPELHLNPRLIRGLPQFYKKNLGEELGNQIWLVSHSDALLREVVGRDGYNVFHMLPCGKVPLGESQLKP
ncbi:ATP-binding protein [Pandoraea apista]|nr:AAA family ATPase [Pandoraea apista]RSK88464.1 ATP-binding protein [Pandoraea apista]